jgi:hypothetical protein
VSQEISSRGPNILLFDLIDFIHIPVTMQNVRILYGWLAHAAFVIFAFVCVLVKISQAFTS